MKTCLYNFDPLKPHFYIVKLGFIGVNIIFLISARKHRLWVLVLTVLTGTHNLCFEQKYEKYQSFSSENFQFFLEVKFTIYLNRRVFVMANWTGPYNAGRSLNLHWTLLKGTVYSGVLSNCYDICDQCLRCSHFWYSNFILSRSFFYFIFIYLFFFFHFILKCFLLIC